jgi:hypothetical protein
MIVGWSIGSRFYKLPFQWISGVFTGVFQWYFRGACFTRQLPKPGDTILAQPINPFGSSSSSSQTFGNFLRRDSIGSGVVASY